MTARGRGVLGGDGHRVELDAVAAMIPLLRRGLGGGAARRCVGDPAAAAVLPLRRDDTVAGFGSASGRREHGSLGHEKEAKRMEKALWWLEMGDGEGERRPGVL